MGQQLGYTMCKLIYCVLLNLVSCKLYLVEVENSSTYPHYKPPLNQNVGEVKNKREKQIQDYNIDRDQDNYNDYLNMEEIGGALSVLGDALKAFSSTNDSSAKSTDTDLESESKSTPDDSVGESETSKSG